MGFDLTNTITDQDGSGLEYGVIRGNDSIVVIKAGAGGSYMGSEDRYLKLAERLHAQSGCTVVCLSNFSRDSFERTDVGVIRTLISEATGDVRLYYVGVSNGATQGLIDATRYFAFERILLFNLPLMINFHKTTAALRRVDSEVRFVYGEKDPSYSYVPFLEHAARKDTCAACVGIVTVPEADHNFAGMLDAFLDLATGVLRA